MIIPTEEYIVDEVSGRSPSLGNPDKTANLVLSRWGLIPKNGSKQDRLFSGAIPPEAFRGRYRLRVWPQGGRLQARFVLLENSEEEPGKLDFGPLLDPKPEPGSTPLIFKMEGNYLAQITLSCQPVKNGKTVAVNDGIIHLPTSSPTPVQAAQPTTDELATIAVNRIRRNKDQPRQNFKAADLHILGQSIREDGQTERIEVIRIFDDPNADFELIKGERRWRAAELVGLTELEAIIKSPQAIPDKATQHRVCLISDLHHSDYSDVEIAFALAYQREHTKATLQQLATMCKKKSLGWVSQHLAITKLHPDLLRLLNPDLPRKEQLSFSLAWRIARLNHAEQLQVYEQVKKVRGSGLQILETERLVAELRPGENKKMGSADLYRNLGPVANRLLADASKTLAYREDVFLGLVEYRPRDEVELILERLKEAAGKINSLRTKILAAREKVKKSESL